MLATSVEVSFRRDCIQEGLSVTSASLKDSGARGAFRPLKVFLKEKVGKLSPDRRDE
jgi:hypothetical protein